MTGITKAKNESSSHHGPVVGSSSIIMTFTVLCLTMFATLTLTQSQNELKLSSAYSESVENYAKADAEASRILAGAYEAADNGNFAEYAAGKGAQVFGNQAIFMVEIDSKQGLEISLTETDGKVTIDSWTIVYLAQWRPDTNLNVFGGNS